MTDKEFAGWDRHKTENLLAQRDSLKSDNLALAKQVDELKTALSEANATIDVLGGTDLAKKLAAEKRLAELKANHAALSDQIAQLTESLK